MKCRCDYVYKACIRSRMEYCYFIYPLNNKKLLKIERVQWKACRVITGCMMSTHTQSLKVIAENKNAKNDRKIYCCFGIFM